MQYIYVFSKQYYRLARCANKVDVIITDSPLMLSPFYNKDPDIAKPLTQLAYATTAKFDNLNYFVNRVKKYNPIGRLETQNQSDEKAILLKDMLTVYDIKCIDIDGDLMSADIVVQNVLDKLKR